MVIQGLLLVKQCTDLVGKIMSVQNLMWSVMQLVILDPTDF